MKYETKSEEELRKLMLIPEGIYPFEVVSSEEKLSKSGNEMIAINLKLFADDGSTNHIFDYLLAHMPSMLFKLRHFCNSTSMLDQYERGLTGEDCLGACGTVKIKHRKEQDGTIRATVADYVSGDAAKSKPEPVLNDIEDDDIPF